MSVDRETTGGFSQHAHHLLKIILNVHRHLDESARAVLQNHTTVDQGKQDDQNT